MALCQLCGLPLDGDLMLEDEATDNLSAFVPANYNSADTAFNARPEVRILQNTVDITKQNTKNYTGTLSSAPRLNGWLHRVEP